jgi:hypothetical protein
MLSGTVIGRLNQLHDDYTQVSLSNTSVGSVVDRSGFTLSTGGVDDIWQHSIRDLTSLGFALDSSDFGDSCFDEVHFTDGFFDSAQGAAGTLDSSDIARAVWNAPSANHVSPGTFGDYLDADVSALGMGSGAYSVIVAVVDTATSQSLAGVAVAVRNLDQTSLLAVSATDLNGFAQFNLASGSYLMVARAPGYLFEPFDTLVVDGGVTDSILARRFDPGEPVSASLCRVHGFLYSVMGEPEAGLTVSACLPKGVTRAGNMIVSPAAVTSTSDSTGYFYLDLIPSDSLAGEPKYEITVNRTDGTILRKRLSVPAQGSWQIVW